MRGIQYVCGQTSHCVSPLVQSGARNTRQRTQTGPASGANDAIKTFHRKIVHNFEPSRRTHRTLPTNDPAVANTGGITTPTSLADQSGRFLALYFLLAVKRQKGRNAEKQAYKRFHKLYTISPSGGATSRRGPPTPHQRTRRKTAVSADYPRDLIGYGNNPPHRNGRATLASRCLSCSITRKVANATSCTATRVRSVPLRNGCCPAAARPAQHEHGVAV